MFIYRSVVCSVLSDDFGGTVFYGVCCFSTFLRGPSTVQGFRDCVGCQGSSRQLSQTAVHTAVLCPIVPATAVCYGLHLAYAQPFPWSPMEAEASSLSVYSLELAGLSQTLKRNKKQTILKVLCLDAEI